MVELCHLVDCDALAVSGAFGALIALLGFCGLADFLVAAAHCIPHAGVFGSGQDCPTEVVECVMVHILQFIGLPKPIPSPKILRINLNSIPIRLDRPRDILHLQILMSHKRPSSKTSPVQFQRLPKINNGLQMLAHKRIIIPNDAASFGIVFVIVELP